MDTEAAREFDTMPELDTETQTAPDALSAAPEPATDAVPQASPDTVPDRAGAETPQAAPTEEQAIFERWSKTQILFVRDPHAAVTEAEAMIDEVVAARRRAFDAHRASGTDRWRGPTPTPRSWG